MASTIRWWNTSERSTLAGPNERNAWNTSGMSTVRASIAVEPAVPGGGEDAVVEAAVGLVDLPHALDGGDVDGSDGAALNASAASTSSPSSASVARSVATSTA